MTAITETRAMTTMVDVNLVFGVVVAVAVVFAAAVVVDDG